MLDELLEGVEGWLTTDEARLLHDLAENARPEVVELGSFHGRSTICLATGYTRGKVISIDDHRYGSGLRFDENLKARDLLGRVEQVREPTEGCHVPTPIGLLFVDADHTYQSVSTDLERFAPSVLHGGWVVCHDYISVDYPDVQRAVDDFLDDTRAFKLDRVVDSIAVLERTS